MNLKNIKIPSALDIFSYATMGDIGSVIAIYKFIEVRNLIAFANHSIELADKTDDEIIKYHRYRIAILDYNACFDYILQIIYFGFDFCSSIYNQNDYKNELTKCVLTWNENGDPLSQFAKDMDEIANSGCDTSKNFIEEFKSFKKSLRKGNAKIHFWANNIKHHGGFVTESLLNACEVARFTIKQPTDNSTLFDSEFMYPFVESTKKIKDRLIKQNELTIDYLTKLYQYLFGTPPLEFGSVTKIFSANKYNKEIFKGNTFMR